jgi:hypothetical protein
MCTMQAAGLGLVANSDLQPGAFIGEYTGLVQTEASW